MQNNIGRFSSSAHDLSFQDFYSGSYARYLNQIRK